MPDAVLANQLQQCIKDVSHSMLFKTGCGWLLYPILKESLKVCALKTEEKSTSFARLSRRVLLILAPCHASTICSNIPLSGAWCLAWVFYKLLVLLGWKAQQSVLWLMGKLQLPHTIPCRLQSVDEIGKLSQHSLSLARCAIHSFLWSNLKS